MNAISNTFSKLFGGISSRTVWSGPHRLKMTSRDTSGVIIGAVDGELNRSSTPA